MWALCVPCPSASLPLQHVAICTTAREWYNDYWQLTFCNLTFWLVRFLNKHGEDFGQKICLLACAIAKTMNTKGFLCFPTCQSLDEIPPWSHSQENSLVELPCETICVTIVYKRKWNISWILAYVILRRWKGNERPRKIELIPVTLCTSTLYLVKSKLACFCLRTNKVRWWVFSSWSLLTRTKCISSWRYCPGWSRAWSYDTHKTFDMRSIATKSKVILKKGHTNQA